MKHLFSILLLLVFVFLSGCEKADTLEELTPVIETPKGYEAFYVGYGGGWGIDVWYRITDEEVDLFNHQYGFSYPEDGYADPDAWTIVTNTELIDQLRGLETDFPAESFDNVEQSFCPEMSYDGTCLRVGYGTMNPDDATVWFRNGAEDLVAAAYLVRVNTVLYGE